jgi:predicted RNA-binding Zn-ribbon protein involved in translation (DUF1610 family)
MTIEGVEVSSVFLCVFCGEDSLTPGESRATKFRIVNLCGKQNVLATWTMTIEGVEVSSVFLCVLCGEDL